MSVKSGNLSPIEKELRFKQWCQESGIERFLFDMDQTISATKTVIARAENLASDLLTKKAGILTYEQWWKEIKLGNDRLFESLAVNPVRWSCAIDGLVEKYQLSEELIQEAKKSVPINIYDPP